MLSQKNITSHGESIGNGLLDESRDGSGKKQQRTAKTKS
jgi:hypothetical protein